MKESSVTDLVEEVIRTGVSWNELRDGIQRTYYRSGEVTVVTEEQGRIVVTVLTR